MISNSVDSSIRPAPRPHSRARLAGLAMLSIALAFGCSDSTNDGGANPNFLMAMAVFNPDGVSGLIFPVDDLESMDTVDLGSALEVPGGAFLGSIPDSTDFLVSSASEPTLTRFSFTNGGFVEGETMTLAGLGVSGGIRTFRVVSDTQGWIATRGGTLVEFNPSEMTVLREVRVQGMERDGFAPPVPSSLGRSFLVGSSLFFNYAWYEPDTDIPRNEVATVHIDLSDGNHSVSFLEGCGDLDAGFVDSAGNVSWMSATTAVAAARAFFGAQSARTCLVRLPAGETSLEAAEVFDLETLAGTPAGNVLNVGGGAGVLRVLDPNYDLSEALTANEVFDAPAWKWSRIEFDSKAISDIPELPTGAGSTSAFDAGEGEQYIGLTEEDRSSTQFARITGTDFIPGLRLPGFFLGGIRL